MGRSTAGSFPGGGPEFSAHRSCCNQGRVGLASRCFTRRVTVSKAETGPSPANPTLAMVETPGGNVLPCSNRSAQRASADVGVRISPIPPALRI